MKKLLELENTDIPEDEILEYYLGLAIQMIYSICNTESLPECYNNIIVEQGIYLFLNKDTLNLKSHQEGERVSTYCNAEDGIPDYIKRALPLPRVDVQGFSTSIHFDFGVELEITKRVFCKQYQFLKEPLYFSIGEQLYKPFTHKEWDSYVEIYLYKMSRENQ